MGRSKELLKSSLSIGVGTIASKILTFALVPLYSLWLSPSEYGTFDLVATYITLFVPFATLQLEQALYRYAVEFPDESKTFYSTVFNLALPLLAALAAVMYIALHFWLKVDYAIGFVLYFVSFALFNINAEYLRGLKRLKAYSAANASFAVLLVILTTIFIGQVGCGLNGMLLVYAGSYFIVAIVIFAVFRPWVPRLGSLVQLRSFLSFSLPLIPNSVSWWIANVANRSFVSLLLGTAANGLFAVSSKIPTIVSLLFSVFNLAFQQTAITSLDDADRYQYFENIFRVLIKVLASGCIVIMTLTPIFYRVFIDQRYWDGIVCVPFLLAGAIMLGLAQYLGDIMLAARETKAIGSSTVIAAIATILFNVILVPTFGLVGASISTFLSYVLMFAIRLKKLSCQFNTKHIVSDLAIWMTFFSISSTAALLLEYGSLVYAAATATFLLFCVAANIGTLKTVFVRFREG